MTHQKSFGGRAQPRHSESLSARQSVIPLPLDLHSRGRGKDGNKRMEGKAWKGRGEKEERVGWKNGNGKLRTHRSFQKSVSMSNIEPFRQNSHRRLGV